MKVFGIILEANPFHNGHNYLIEHIRHTFQPDVLIAVTSTSFTMRGEISLLNKFEKTKILLHHQVDLVVELPIFKSLQSANSFAENAICILAQLGVTDIAFGSESNNCLLYDKALSLLLDFEKSNYFLDQSMSLKQHFTAYLNHCHISESEIATINSPNFTLGLQYIYAIHKHQFHIQYHPILRIGNQYHDKAITSSYASATAIRELLYNKEDVSSYIPPDVSIQFDLLQAEKYLFALIEKTCWMDNLDSLSLLESNEGILMYVKKQLNSFSINSYQDLLQRLKNKKYTLSRMRRALLHILLQTPKRIDNEEPYLRILGLNSYAKEYIRKLPKQTKNYLFSSPKEMKQSNIQLLLELKATRLYGILTEQPNLYINEFKLPIRKET
ncbi:MAG: nucleotidyltransferase family protein [Prevotella sp.]|nr:nucleotidyltransferase family protein [Staphylococcus sp.]MCM1349731.1 nucleotidyltransferase family protein [Prevotella sp.]